MNNYLENTTLTNATLNLKLFELLSSSPEIYNNDDARTGLNTLFFGIGTQKQPQKQQQQQQQLTRRLVPIIPKPPINKVLTTPSPPLLSAKIEPELSKPTFLKPGSIALKRARNTDAARRSRLRKVERLARLEKKVTELEGNHSKLATRLAVLKTDKATLASQDQDNQERIKALEAQLATIHQTLTRKDIY